MKAHLWDVLKRQKIQFQDLIRLYLELVPIELFCITAIYLPSLPSSYPQMPSKKKARPLHVSLYHIEQERKNVKLRTAARIATLLASSIPPDEPRVPVPVPVQQSCLSINVLVLSLCCLLLTLNLVFLQWAYIQVTLHVKLLNKCNE